MKIIPLHAFHDNYIFALLEESTLELAVVDPGDAKPVLNFIKETNAHLTTVLITHHHSDHTGGIEELLKAHPTIRVIGARNEKRIKHVNTPVEIYQSINVLNKKVSILDLKGHTRTHLGYFFPSQENLQDSHLFSGDTIFGSTCGNIFEGTIEDMFTTLSTIRSLPPATRIWCAHEYTLMYLPEAMKLEPWNLEIKKRYSTLFDNQKMFQKNTITVPLILEEELETNPFLRWDNPLTTQHHNTKPGFETFASIING